jgi:hypothetical protein
MAEYFSFVDSPSEEDAPEEDSVRKGEAAAGGRGDRSGGGDRSGREAQSPATDDEVSRILESARQEVSRRKGADRKGAAQESGETEAAWAAEPAEEAELQATLPGEREQSAAAAEAAGGGMPKKGSRRGRARESGPATAGNPGNAVAALIFDTVGVKSARDLRRLLRRGPGFDAAVSLALFLLVALGILLQPELPAVIAAVLSEEFGRPAEAGLFDPVLTAFAVFLLVWSLGKAYRIGTELQRRRLFFRLVSRMEAKRIVSRQELRAYAVERFKLSRPGF